MPIYPHGDSRYSGKSRNNPVTPKQKVIIEIIEKEHNVKFTGTTSRLAYSFIQQYTKKDDE
jgi:hypothetical protein